MRRMTPNAHQHKNFKPKNNGARVVSLCKSLGLSLHPISRCIICLADAIPIIPANTPYTDMNSPPIVTPPHNSLPQNFGNTLEEHFETVQNTDSGFPSLLEDSLLCGRVDKAVCSDNFIVSRVGLEDSCAPSPHVAMNIDDNTIDSRPTSSAWLVGNSSYKLGDQNLENTLYIPNLSAN